MLFRPLAASSGGDERYTSKHHRHDEDKDHGRSSSRDRIATCDPLSAFALGSRQLLSGRRLCP